MSTVTSTACLSKLKSRAEVAGERRGSAATRIGTLDS